MLLLASITESLANFATNVVGDLGLAGVFFLMLLESACIPVPSEATMLFAGFNVALGHYSLLEATFFGVLGNLVGSWIAYGIGYYGRIELLEKHGRKLHVKPQQLQSADRFFARYGAASVLIARVLPIVRTFISLPAGVARMPFWRFSTLTVIGCIPWVFLLTFVGQQARHNWVDWKDKLHYVDYAMAVLIVVGIVYLVVKRRRGGDDVDGRRSPESPASEAEPTAGPIA